MITQKSGEVSEHEFNVHSPAAEDVVGTIYIPEVPGALTPSFLARAEILALNINEDTGVQVSIDLNDSRVKSYRIGLKNSLGTYIGRIGTFDTSTTTINQTFSSEDTYLYGGYDLSDIASAYVVSYDTNIEELSSGNHLAISARHSRDSYTPSSN